MGRTTFVVLNRLHCFASKSHHRDVLLGSTEGAAPFVSTVGVRCFDFDLHASLCLEQFQSFCWKLFESGAH